MKRSMFVPLVVLFVAVALAACAAPTAAPPVVQTVAVPQTVVSQQTVVVPQTVVAAQTVVVQVTPNVTCAKPSYVITAPLVHPYITQWQTAAEEAGKELGVEVVYLSPAAYDPQKQVDMTESSLSLPCVEGLSVMTGVPDIMEGVLKQAAGLGIATTQNASCDTAVNAGICLATDFTQAGASVGERLAKMMNGKGNIVVAFGAPGDKAHQQRVDGLTAYLAKNAPDIKILGTLLNCDDAEGTVKCAENALTTYPTMNAYYGTGNLTAVGALQVFPQAGKSDVIITGVDDDPAIIAGIQKGSNVFTYVQQPYGQGYLAVYIPWLMKHKGLKPTQKYLDTGITFVDKTNVTTYQDTMKANFTELKKAVDTQIMK
ncbi:MAG: sugar ABC transporter substrate-binding protein [Chloroflexi bacterium]|nr:sugar ABC transporter substrate-binding protein [Chloroflexota bacterium]